MKMDENKPHLTENGTLVIPADCEEKYRWWADGQPISDTLKELNASRTVWMRYSFDPYPDDLQKEVYPLLDPE